MDRSLDERVATALVEYTEALESGHAPDRERFLARHSEISAELAPCLDAVDLVFGRADSTAPSPRTLGDFELIRQVGRGGMGVVYEAEQISLQRRVALKMLPFAGILDQRHLRRFRNEARAAAHLHHTNIVPVYSVGSERGVHFYAMQFIDGMSVAEMIAELKETAGRDQPPSSSSTAVKAVTGGSETRSVAYCRAIARLGVQAAEALDHAHEQGVIHRDIKPGNLLLDATGRPWITDFGLASFRSAPGPTLTGDLVGTVRYMSPEQALAKRVPVDHRTDVYSLGVTLYELLTLQPAFSGEDPHKVIQEIAFKEPRPPRQLNPAVPEELETILVKAYSKGPDERYATALGLAQDLERYLDDRPIEARRPSLVKRAARWARRHRTLVGAAMIVLILAGVSAGTASIFVWRAYQNEAAERARAEDNLSLFLRGLDKVAFPLPEEMQFDREEPTAAERDRLRGLLAIYEEFVQRNRGHPAVRASIADARRRIGRLHRLLGEDEDALQAFQMARGVALELVRGLPRDQLHRLLLSDCTEGLAFQFDQMGRTDESVDLYGQAEELAEALAEESPENPVFLEHLFWLHRSAARSGFVRGRSDCLERHVRRALEVAEIASARFPDEIGWKGWLVAALNDVAKFGLPAQADPESKRKLMERVIRMGRELVEEWPSSDRLQYRVAHSDACWFLARTLWTSGRCEEARDYLRMADDANEELLRRFPRREAFRFRRAMIRHTQAYVLADSVSPEQARRLYREAMGEMEALACDRPEVDSYRFVIADWLFRQQTDLALEREEEIEVMARAAALLDHLIERLKLGEWYGGQWTEWSPSLEILRLLLARARLRHAVLVDLARDADEGHALLVELEEDLASWVVENPESVDYKWLLCMARFTLGHRLLERQLEETRLWWRRAVETYEALRAEHTDAHSNSMLQSPTRAEIMRDVGWALLSLGDAADAERALRSAVQMMREVMGTYASALHVRNWSEGQAIALDLLGVALHHLGRNQESYETHLEAGDLWKQLGNPARLARNRLYLASHLAINERRYEEAETLTVQAVELCEEVSGRDPAWRRRIKNVVLQARAHHLLWSVYRHTGRKRMARDVVRKLLQLDLARVHPNWLNEIAWILATDADPESGDAAAAVRLAEPAVAQAPRVGALWNTLGVARYRAGDWEGCLKALEESKKLQSGGTAYDWFFIAMAHAKLGHPKAIARTSFDKAVAWMEEHEPDDEELERFRAEAEETLEIG
jgi:serine/threonine protein kinase